MEKGADTLTAFGAECPLIVASIRGHLDIVKFLIETISAEDDFMYDWNTGCALVEACRWGNFEVAECLIDAGAPMGNNLALVYLADAGSLGTIRKMIFRSRFEEYWLIYI